MSTTREAYDLTHPGCRENLRKRLDRGGLQSIPWNLVLSDTLRRVCSKSKQKHEQGDDE